MAEKAGGTAPGNKKKRKSQDLGKVSKKGKCTATAAIMSSSAEIDDLFQKGNQKKVAQMNPGEDLCENSTTGSQRKKLKKKSKVHNHNDDDGEDDGGWVPYDDDDDHNNDAAADLPYGIIKSAVGYQGVINPEAPVHRIDKETGLPVYKAHLLKVGEGGGTALCPFDCSCCF